MVTAFSPSASLRAFICSLSAVIHSSFSLEQLCLSRLFTVGARDMSRAPTVNNLLKHNCSKLKELWITALNEQMKALKEAEGENAVTMPYLVHELALARDFDGKKEEKAFSENKNVPFS